MKTNSTLGQQKYHCDITQQKNMTRVVKCKISANVKYLYIYKRSCMRELFGAGESRLFIFFETV